MDDSDRLGKANCRLTFRLETKCPATCAKLDTLKRKQLLKRRAIYVLGLWVVWVVLSRVRRAVVCGFRSGIPCRKFNNCHFLPSAAGR